MQLKSTENDSCLPALEVPPDVCGLGSLRTTSLFATSHMSATLGNVKPPQYDFRRKFIFVFHSNASDYTNIHCDSPFFRRKFA